MEIMNIGIVGLGRMGFSIAARLLRAGFTVYGFDQSTDIQHKAEKIGISIVQTLSELAKQAGAIWIMVPIDAVDSVIQAVQPHVKAGDIIVDGGNSFYKDSIRRAQSLKKAGIYFLDCGTSGGILGEKEGFCLMVGGEKEAYAKMENAFAAIAALGGVAHIGASGSGHYVKMVHNGIEYALLQAYGEGLMLIKEGSFKDEAIDLEQLTRIWQTSSIIRSLLLDLTHGIMQKDQELDAVSGELAEGGTGAWTVEQANEEHISIPVIKTALDVRAWSRKTGGDYATKVVAMLRHAFGGHAVKKIKT